MRAATPVMQAWDGFSPGQPLACLTTAFLAPHIARIAETAVEGGIAGELAVAMALFLMPSAAMGALFGLLAQRVRDQRGSLGWAVGINSIGASMAPLLTAQFLIPAFGAWTALIPVALGYLLLVPLRRAALVWSAAPAVAALMPVGTPYALADKGAAGRRAARRP